MEVAGSSSLNFDIYCGRNTIAEASLKVSSPDTSISMERGSYPGEISPNGWNVFVSDIAFPDGTTSVAFDKDRVLILDAKAESVLRLSIPHGASSQNGIIVSINFMSYLY